MSPIGPTIHPSTHEIPGHRLRGRQIDWAGVGVSFLIHVNVLILLAVTFRYWNPQESPPSVIKAVLVSEEEPLETDVPLIENGELSKSKDIELDTIFQTMDSLLKPQTDDDWAGAKGLVDGFGLKKGRTAKGDGQQGNAGFFGTRAQGQSFVFVVDCSGSMQGYRFRRTIRELKQSVGSLASFQQFQIVFFSDQEYPWIHPTHLGELLPATPEVVGETILWIETQKAGGGTAPHTALKRALGLEPDVVFFLSDAHEIPRGIRNLITKYNERGSIVHTIAFGHRGGEALMQGIAKDHHGRYRFVP